MAKSLREQPPSSSVARLFDLTAAARATSAVPTEPPVTHGTDEPVVHRRVETSMTEFRPAPTTEAPASEPWSQQPTIKRELVLTPSTDETFSRLVELFRRSTGTRLTNSHVARALLKGVAHCMDQIQREADRVGRQRLPSNARAHELHRERFEAILADAIIAAIRASAAYDPGRR